MKLIDKDVVVAEIDDWRDKIKKAIFIIPLEGRQRADAAFEYEILGKVRDLLDAFESKEVDINKEISQFIDANFENATIGHKLSLRRVAKHFFELGMAVGNKAYKRVSMKELDKYFSGELDPNIQYASIEQGVKAFAEEYSFNIESELFNQLTKEQQALWRKEIEQAVISGGEQGLELARDIRYKENFETKKVDLECELNNWRHEHFHGKRDRDAAGEYLERNSQLDIAKYFYRLGLKEKKGEEV